MGNPFFQAMGNAPQQAQPQAEGNDFLKQVGANPQAYVSDIKSNTHEFLKKCGVNVPENMNDPGQIFQYLIQTGQRQMPGRGARGFGRR